MGKQTGMVLTDLTMLRSPLFAFEGLDLLLVAEPGQLGVEIEPCDAEEFQVFDSVGARVYIHGEDVHRGRFVVGGGILVVDGHDYGAATVQRFTELLAEHVLAVGPGQFGWTQDDVLAASVDLLAESVSAFHGG